MAMGFKGRKPLYGAGESFYGYAGGKSLIVAQEDEIWVHLPHGSEIVLRFSENDVCIRKGCGDGACVPLRRLERGTPLDHAYRLIVCNDDPQFSAFAGFGKKEPVSRVEIVERAEDEYARPHLVPRSIEYTLFSSIT